jgi:hypothetical protein
VGQRLARAGVERGGAGGDAAGDAESPINGVLCPE